MLVISVKLCWLFQKCWAPSRTDARLSFFLFLNKVFGLSRDLNPLLFPFHCQSRPHNPPCGTSTVVRNSWWYYLNYWTSNPSVATLSKDFFFNLWLLPFFLFFFTFVYFFHWSGNLTGSFSVFIKCNLPGNISDMFHCVCFWKSEEHNFLRVQLLVKILQRTWFDVCFVLIRIYYYAVMVNLLFACYLFL